MDPRRSSSGGRGIYPNERSYALPDCLRSADTGPGRRGRPGCIGRTRHRTRPHSARKTCRSLSFAVGGRAAYVGRKLIDRLPATARLGLSRPGLRPRHLGVWHVRKTTQFRNLSGCTQQIGFAVGVLILAQRQAVLVAKQAASLDQSSDGRWGACRSGMAGTPKRLSGAVQNTATATCRSPIPRRGPSGMGSRFGSPRAPAHQRIGGAKPSFGKRTEVTHVTAHTTYISGHHKRIPGRNVADHWTLITHYREAVADLL